jgi:hypothetical protein
MKLTDLELESIALHEAGHVVCARALGIPFSSVSIEPGIVHTTVKPTWGRLEKWLTMYAAGTGSNVLFQNLGWDYAWDLIGSSDLEQVRLLSWGRDFNEVKAWSQERAEELLWDRRRDVEVIARHLAEVKSGSLTSDVVDVQLAVEHQLQKGMDRYRERYGFQE